jgi:uncharacterized protein
LAKLILIVAGIFLAWWLLRKYFQSFRSKQQPPSLAEDMVRCAHCGVHLPRSEGLADNGRIYCSEEHRRLDG